MTRNTAKQMEIANRLAEGFEARAGELERIGDEAGCEYYLRLAMEQTDKYYRLQEEGR